MQGQTPASTDQPARIITLIAAGLVPSVLVYIGVAFLVVRTAAASSDDTEFIQLMAAFLAGVSLSHLVAYRIAFIVSFVLRSE